MMVRGTRTSRRPDRSHLEGWLLLGCNGRIIGAASRTLLLLVRNGYSEVLEAAPRVPKVTLQPSNEQGFRCGPGALDQHVANTTVACLCDAAPSDCLSSRPLTRNKANIAHELARAFETAHVPNLGSKRHATIRSTPRNVCSARTIGASDQAGTNSSITRSSRSARSFEMRTASTISWSAI